MDDGKIMELFFARDEQALSAAAEKYEHYLFTIAMNVLSDRQDSEECVNDTWLRAWESIPPNHPKSLQAFLSTLVRDRAIDIWRRKHRDKRIGSEYELSLSELSEAIPGHSDVEKAVESAELSELIGSFLRKAGRDVRNVFLLRYYYHDSVRDIAAATGFSTAKVKVLLHRTRLKLRKELEKEGYTYE